MCPLNSFTRGRDPLQTSEWSEVNKEVPMSDLENCSLCVCVCVCGVVCERERTGGTWGSGVRGQVKECVWKLNMAWPQAQCTGQNLVLIVGSVP